MTKENKDNNDLLSELEGVAKEAFGIAVSGIKGMGDNLRTSINAGREIAETTYEIITDTVGKDRAIGAVVGAKAGGVIGVVGSVPGIIVGGAIGSAIGFFSGRRVYAWLEAGRTNDNKEQKPKDPAP